MYVDEHNDIVEMIEAGKPGQAKVILAKHLERFRNILMTAIREHVMEDNTRIKVQV